MKQKETSGQTLCHLLFYFYRTGVDDLVVAALTGRNTVLKIGSILKLTSPEYKQKKGPRIKGEFVNNVERYLGHCRHQGSN